ncbi:hypothetical protein J3F83DRAFT_126440 [Trichoderma novae-zelandiae]
MPCFFLWLSWIWLLLFWMHGTNRRGHGKNPTFVSKVPTYIEYISSVKQDPRSSSSSIKDILSTDLILRGIYSTSGWIVPPLAPTNIPPLPFPPSPSPYFPCLDQNSSSCFLLLFQA